jgi:hypothetical protein
MHTQTFSCLNGTPKTHFNCRMFFLQVCNVDQTGYNCGEKAEFGRIDSSKYYQAGFWACD